MSEAPPPPPPPPEDGTYGADGALTPAERRQPLDLGEVMGEAWKLLIEDLGPYVVATLVYSAIVFVTCGLGVLVSGPLFGGLAVMSLMALRGERPTFDDVFAGFRFFGPLFLLSLVAFAGIFVGLLFCFLPGVYLAIAWVFAPFLVIDRRMDFLDAMALSMRTVNAHFVPVAVLTLVLGAINVLGSSVVLGFVLTQPLCTLAVAVAYRRLFGLSERTGDLTTTG